MLSLATEGASVPISEISAIVLLVSLAITVGWLYRLYQ
jgi:hypothetical protein